MTKIEKASAVIGIAMVIFGAGAGWMSINTRFDTLTEHIERVEKDRSEGLCLTILTRQIVAIERGRDAVGEQLQTLSDRHCPVVPDAEMAAATRPMTPAERAADEQRRQVEYLEAMRELSRINDELDATVRAECTGPNC